MPRIYMEAAKPVMSPVTPPPSATAKSFLENLFFAIKLTMSRTVPVFFDFSPASNV